MERILDIFSTGSVAEVPCGSLFQTHTDITFSTDTCRLPIEAAVLEELLVEAEFFCVGATTH